MPDHESAVQAWLDSPDTLREIEVALKKVPNISYQQAVMLALGVEILASLNVYGTDEPCEECQREAEEQDDDGEPWKGR